MDQKWVGIQRLFPTSKRVGRSTEPTDGRGFNPCFPATQLIPKGQADLESKRWQESYGMKTTDPDDDKPKKTYQKHTYVPLIVSETGIPTHKNWTSTWKMEELYQLHPGLDRFFVAFRSTTGPPSIDGAMGWNRLGWSCFCCTKCNKSSVTTVKSWMSKWNLQEMRSTISVSVYSISSVCYTIWLYIWCNMPKWNFGLSTTINYNTW